MAEEITLKVNVETGKAVTNLGNLEKATKGVTKATKQADKGAETLEQQFDTLNKEIKEGPVNIRRMNKQIQEYQAIALEAGRTSPLGKRAIQEAAQLKDKYNDITAEVNRLANDGVRMQAALDLGTSVIAGYTAFQGAMALAGVDSEEFRETLMKLQGAQALLMGVETIRKNLEKESTLVLQAKTAAEKASIVVTKIKTFVTNGATAATKLLRIALISLPFVAIGVAIVAVIKNFDKLSKLISGTTKAQETLNKVTETAIENSAKELSAADKLHKVLEDEKISREDKVKAVKELQLEYPSLLSNVDAEKDSIEDINKALELNVKLLVLKAKQDAIAELRAEEFKKQISETTKVQTGQNVSTWDSIKAIAVQGVGLSALGDSQDFANASSAEAIKLSKETVKGLDNVEKGIQAEIDALTEEGAVIDENGDKSKKAAADKLKRQEERKKLRKEQAKLEKQAIYDLALAQKQANAEEIIDAEVKTKALIEIEKFKLEQQLKDKKLTDTQKKLLEFQTEEAIDKIKEKYAKIDLDRQQAINKKINDEQNTLLLSVEKLENAHFNRITEDQKRNAEIEINAIYDKYNAQIEALKSRNESTKILEEAQGAEIEKINKKYKEQELIDTQEIKNAKIQASVDSIGAIINLTSAFAKDNEKSQRRAFEINKKLQIAQALIQTYQGVQAIFSSAAANPLSIPFPAYPYIQSAIALTTGLANIQNIRKQQFSGGSAGGSFGGGGGGVPSGGQAPQIAPVTNTSTLVPQEAQQVYVTETDISNIQNKVAVIEGQATIK